MTKDVRVIRPTAEGLDAHKTRVAAYCRVSTDSADQVNSFIAQVKYYNDYIRVSKDLVLVDVYADEGITGTCTAKREEFNRMIRDSKLGKIDRIFVKSVSRFARNSLECIENIRLLKSYGTTVLFENDGIDTSCMNSEMILYIKSAFAQSEALSGSKRVSTAIRMKMETGTFCTYHAPFGYKLENGTLIPVDEEIKIVKRIFDDYLHGKGHNKIAMELNDENAISDATTDLNDYMKQYNNTGGDKTKYIECIQQTSEKIRLLRIELDTAKAKISQNEKINQEVERLTKWLTENDVSFESYDDVVVRRIVELIRVNNDSTITVFSKFGSEFIENL